MEALPKVGPTCCSCTIFAGAGNLPLSKICAKSFGGYAKQQISKAKGQDKKQNWEKDKVTRKTPLDFCYIHRGEKSISLVNFMEEKGMDQRFCGLSNIPHSRDTYALFYDFKEEETNGEIKNLGFKGIAFEDSNQVRLSSIPVDVPKNYFIGHVSYNKDGEAQVKRTTTDKAGKKTTKMEIVTKQMLDEFKQDLIKEISQMNVTHSTPRKLMRNNDLMEYLGCSYSTIENLRNAG